MSLVSPVNRQLPAPPSPQIFFRQAPAFLQPASSSHSHDEENNIRASPEDFSNSESPVGEPDTPQMRISTTMMDHYRRHSLSSSDCTRRSILSVQDEPFTPVRNLAILNYQKRSIFSHTIANSENTDTEKSFSVMDWWPCSNVLWKGHEKFCIASAFLALLFIIIGGIVGMYFACKYQQENEPGKKSKYR